jgi:hypothetical protein
LPGLLPRGWNVLFGAATLGRISADAVESGQGLLTEAFMNYLDFMMKSFFVWGYLYQRIGLGETDPRKKSPFLSLNK